MKRALTAAALAALVALALGLLLLGGSSPSYAVTPTVGQLLTASNGTWLNTPTSFAYQWEDCDTVGANCTSISGATSSTYTVTGTDVGFTIRVLVTASNAGGSASSTSAPTGAVTSPLNVAPTITASCTASCTSSTISWQPDSNATDFKAITTTNASPATITRQTGFPKGAHASGGSVPTLTFTPTATGDLLVVTSGDFVGGGGGTTATGVSCTCVSGGFTKVRSIDDPSTYSVSMWEGVLTSSGSSITVSTTGLTTGDIELQADELHASIAGATWGTDGSGVVQQTFSTPGYTVNFPSITPTKNATEAYEGYSTGVHTATAGSTTGFTYTTSVDNNLDVFNPTVASGSAYAPTATNSASFSNNLAIVVYATGAGSSSTTDLACSSCTSWSPPADAGNTDTYQIESLGAAGTVVSTNSVSIGWIAGAGANVTPALTLTCAPNCSAATSASVTWSNDTHATGFKTAVCQNARPTADPCTYGTLPFGSTSWTVPTACGATVYYGLASQGTAGELFDTDVTGKHAIWAACVGGAFQVGIVPGGGSCCGSSVDQGMKNQGFGFARVDPTVGAGPPSDFYGVGLNVNLLIGGNCTGSSIGGYDTASVSDLNASGWASCAVAAWQNQCGASTVKCPVLEELNEPAGNWFWGSNANTQSAADNYARLIQATWNAFHTTYGSSCDTGGACPLLIASWDGGCDNGGCSWGQKVIANGVGIVPNNFVNGWTVHPYAQDSNAQGGCQNEGTGLASAASDNWDTSMGNITTAHANVSKPLYVTELGWQTSSGACSGAQQAANLYGFLGFAKGSGYIAGVYYFQYSDYGGVAFGLVGNTQGTSTIQGNKPAWTALNQYVLNQSCTVCGGP